MYTCNCIQCESYIGDRDRNCDSIGDTCLINDTRVSNRGHRVINTPVSRNQREPLSIGEHRRDDEEDEVLETAVKDV